MISFSLIAMPMSCLLLNEFIGGAVIDAVIPAIYSALLVFGALLFSVSFLALIICVIVILISTNYWALIYHPASLAHSRRKRKLQSIAADGGWKSIKCNASSMKGNNSDKPRYQPESITAYSWRVFYMVKCSLQYGITVLSYRGKREKKRFAAQSVWCGMNRPLLLFRTSEDLRTKFTPSSTSAPSPAYPLPLASYKSFAPPTPSSFPPFSTTFSAHTLSLLPTKSHDNFYTRQARSLGLNGAPTCIRKMLIISADTVLEGREKEKERKREKERSRKQGEKERRREERERERCNGGVGNAGGRGDEMSVGVRGRGQLHHTRQLSSSRSLEDELVVTRTGLADSTRRLVAPSIMFYSGQALTLMRSRLSLHDNVSKSTHRGMLHVNIDEDSFSEADFAEEFRLILDVFYPDGMTLSDEAKEESCELFNIWKNENFVWSNVTAGGTISTHSEVRMINFKMFEDWFSEEFVGAIHSNLSDRIMDNISRSPVLAVTVKNKVNESDRERDDSIAHCTTQSVSWFASSPRSTPLPSSSPHQSSSPPSLSPLSLSPLYPARDAEEERGKVGGKMRSKNFVQVKEKDGNEI